MCGDIYRTFWKRPTYRDVEQIGGCQELVKAGECLTTREQHMRIWESNGTCTFLYLDYGHGYEILCICQKFIELYPEKSGFY